MDLKLRLGWWCAFFTLLASLLQGQAQEPLWIWAQRGDAAAGEVCFFRKEFTVGFDAREAKLTATGDDEITVFLNGVKVGASTYWKEPFTANVTAQIRSGQNVLCAIGKNGTAGPAAIMVKLEVRSPNMFGLFVVSDGSWRWSRTEAEGWHQTGFAGTNWKSVATLGKDGSAPWGNVLQPPSATPAESLSLLPGFKAELLKSALPREGSWICICFDGRGRIIISPEKEEAPMLRVTLDRAGQVVKTEVITCPVRGAMGLLYANESLYVNGRGPRGVGLYRLIDSNGNDQFEAGEEHLLKNFEGDNEHGYHAVVLGPKGAIYVMNGNHTKVPPGIAADSPLRNYAEDLLLPRQWDANGHAKGILAPGGYILRTDAEGKEWRLICGGFRNSYDFDFAPNGEMFTFDSDMEWDVGAPWYRPTRILHCVSGGEYGWRSGTGKWPVYYPDSLPSVVDTGLSSPTGLKFGSKSNFPEKYRKALFAADWAYGRILAVHLEPKGASYGGTFETFLSGKPLAVTSLSFGPDGAMYFIIGGWKIQSGLYRVSWGGGESPSAPREAVSEEVLVRRNLEALHGRRDPGAIDQAWPYLRSEDRWLRFAARTAIESQDVAQWKEKALAETNINGSLCALLALARAGDRSLQSSLLSAVLRLPTGKMSEAQRLEELRVFEVCFTRMGKPSAEIASEIVRQLDRGYPSGCEDVNRELSQLLVYLEAPDVLSKTLALMRAARTQEEQMHYAFVLRNVKNGWTYEQRSVYFTWFNKALREYKGGASFRPYLINIRNDAMANLTEPERNELASLIEERAPAAVTIPQRDFVKQWSLSELEAGLAELSKGRSFARGREAFAAAQCIVCHRVGGEGGAVGPDLAGVASRFGHRDLLENILVPSKIISDRYQSYSINTKNGEQVSGCITEETEDTLTLITNPMTNQREQISKKEIASRAVSKISTMPEGLLNVLQREEILDLLAFIEAEGKASGAAFTPSR